MACKLGVLTCACTGIADPSAAVTTMAGAISHAFRYLLNLVIATAMRRAMATERKIFMRVAPIVWRAPDTKSLTGRRKARLLPGWPQANPVSRCRIAIPVND